MASSPAVLSAGLCGVPSGRRAHTRPDAPNCFASSPSSSSWLREYFAGTGNDEPANFAAASSAVLNGGNADSLNASGEPDQLHPAAQVRLVRSVLGDRLGVRQPAERVRRLAADQPHQAVHQRLDRREHELFGRERNLEVDLRELGLTIGAQVLVAEALDDLEVAVQTGDHQDLLEDLRRLRQRVELAGWTRLGTR